MKKIKLLVLTLIALTTVSSFAADYRIKKVHTLGVMNHKVLFQSRDLKKIPKTQILSGKLVIMWGTQRYEIVDGYYNCSEKNFCKLYDYRHVAMYEKCTVKRKQVECATPVSGQYQDGASNDIRVYDDPDRVYDEYDNGRDNWDSSPEFPVRVNDEFPGLNF